MSATRTLLGGLLLAVALVGCEGDARPSESVGPSARLATPTIDPGAVLLRNMLGKFRPKFVPVSDEIAGVVRDACLAAADARLSFGLTDQPVVIADARGLGLISIILADDAAAFECRARLAEDGASATAFEPPSRLDPSRIGAMERDEISRVSQTVVDDPDGKRTIVIGRVGPDGRQVGVTFIDQTEVVAVVANGWYLAWWANKVEPGGIVSANNRNEVQDSVEHPTELFEGRVAPAAWWVDPAAVPVSGKATRVKAVLRELVCAGGASPKDRVRTPTVVTTPDDVTVTAWVARASGSQDCPGNPEHKVIIRLPEALGGRDLLDGGQVPSRDATIVPA